MYGGTGNGTPIKDMLIITIMIIHIVIAVAFGVVNCCSGTGGFLLYTNELCSDPKLPGSNPG